LKPPKDTRPARSRAGSRRRRRWRGRFARERLAGLEDLPRSGAPPVYGEETDKRIRAVLDRPPPAGFARWNGRLIARALGDVDVQYVWRSLRKQKIDLGGRKSWCESNDPEFAAKAADVVGLYLAPPDNAVVLCIDEKPSIQALERAQGYLKLPNGRALTGHSHDYKRHGTTTLFAAFEVATGKVKARHAKRRRRKEFLEFMDDVVAAYPSTRLEVIMDNLNTHKKNDEWLARHPLVTFHYTPTRASWLNQVEGWFSILQGQSLTGATFNSVEQLKAHIDAFIETYNDDAEPFVWTKSKGLSAPRQRPASQRLVIPGTSAGQWRCRTHNRARGTRYSLDPGEGFVAAGGNGKADPLASPSLRRMSTHALGAQKAGIRAP
jgi:hypothetical protein